MATCTKSDCAFYGVEPALMCGCHGGGSHPLPLTRYEYASFKSPAQAALALEDMFASGDVCEAERPAIEKRTFAGQPSRFVIMLQG